MHYVAGLVGGEGEAAGLAADLGGRFGDLLAELAGQARPGSLGQLDEITVG